jgi:hypothetical protein
LLSTGDECGKLSGKGDAGQGHSPSPFLPIQERNECDD